MYHFEATYFYFPHPVIVLVLVIVVLVVLVVVVVVVVIANNTNRSCNLTGLFVCWGVIKQSFNHYKSQKR